MKITPIQLGLPPQTGTDLFIKVLTFDSDATTGTLYYEVKGITGQRLYEGNISLTEEEFALLGFNKTYLEDITTSKLGLTKDTSAGDGDSGTAGTSGTSGTAGTSGSTLRLTDLGDLPS